MPISTICQQGLDWKNQVKGKEPNRLLAA